MKSNEHILIASVLRAVGHPLRVQILELLECRR
jgi:DNA-binding transcriptional ArsR family regulator